MIINYRKISSDYCNIKNIEELYINSFPSDERREFVKIIELLEDSTSPFKLISVEIDGEFSGFASYWEWDDLRYMEHFAISPDVRGNGIGAKVLEYLRSASFTPIIFEVEHPDDDMAKRRIQFYQRNGFTLHPEIPYMQPAYDDTKSPMPLILMTYGDIQLSENCEFIHRIKKEVYGWEPM